MKAHRFTKAERAQRRANAIRLNLGRNLILGYHGRWWTKRELAMMGKRPDAEVARRIGKSIMAVKVKRIKLGIATAMDRRRRSLAAPGSWFC